MEEVNRRLNNLEADTKTVGRLVSELIVSQKTQTALLTEIKKDVKEVKTVQAKQDVRISKTETHLAWLKGIGSAALAALGIHFTWK